MRAWKNACQIPDSYGVAANVISSTLKIRRLTLHHLLFNRHWTHQSYSSWQIKPVCARTPLRAGILPCISQPRIFNGAPASTSCAQEPNELLDNLLDRAAQYSIPDVASLDFEAAVEGWQRPSKRLIQRPDLQFDYNLWEVFLHYRIHVDGDAGIRAIWTSLTQQYRLKTLPDHWPMEDGLWSIFIGLGLRDHDFLAQIENHVNQLWKLRKLRRHSLCVEVLGGLLKGVNSSLAMAFSNSIHPGVAITSTELRDLFVAAAASADPNALNHFRLICSNVRGHKIYGSVVATLCRENRIAEAIAMHSYLANRSDYPASFEEIEPLLRKIAESNLDLALCTRQLNEAGLSFEGQAQSLQDSVRKACLGISRETLNLAASRTFGVKRTKISDAFAARFFATRAFSFEFALNGIHILGVDELGPLSLRQIAIQSGTADLLRQRIAHMQTVGVDTGGSVYSRLIRRLAKEHKDSLLIDVVHCDQHPEVFGDYELQLRLFAEYHRSKDWRQVNRTLAILEALGQRTLQAPNLLLANAIREDDLPEITKFVGQLNQRCQHVSRSNLVEANKSLIPSRTIRAQGSEKTSHALRYLIQLHHGSIVSGTPVPPILWRELVRRLGIMCKQPGNMTAWTDLEKACQWFCGLYCPGDLSDDFSLGRDLWNDQPSVLPVRVANQHVRLRSTIEDFFSPLLQRTIVEWGFISGLKSKGSISNLVTPSLDLGIVGRRLSVFRGIELLIRLHGQHGVRLHANAIRKGCEERLRQLFASTGSSSAWANCETSRQKRNKLSLCIRGINETFGSTLLDVHDHDTMTRILKSRPAAITARPTTRRDWRQRQEMEDGDSVHKTESNRHDNESVDADDGGDKYVDDDLQEDVVMYRDIFNASWEDYRPTKRQP